MKPHVLVLVKRTSFQTFVLDAKDDRTLRLMRQKNPAVARLRSSHESHLATLTEVGEALDKLGTSMTVLPATPPKTAGPKADDKLFREATLVVTVGGDGTLLAASHRLGPNTPLWGINSAPESSVGFFCAGRRGSAHRTLRAALEDKLLRVRLSRMEVELAGAIVHRRVLNDALFCHASPAATSRYILSLNGSQKGRPAKAQADEQRSSGLWIGPAAGSTAAQRSAGGRILPLRSRALQFVVREPYMRHGRRARLVRGLIREGAELDIVCKMRDARLFLDGDQNVVFVGLGDVVRFRRSSEHLTVLGLRR